MVRQKNPGTAKEADIVKRFQLKQLVDRIALRDPPVGARKNQSDDWPDPKPLRKEIIPVIKMEPTMLPESLRPWNVDIAYRMQCPLDFVGVASICMFRP